MLLKYQLLNLHVHSIHVPYDPNFEIKHMHLHYVLIGLVNRSKYQIVVILKKNPNHINIHLDINDDSMDNQ